MRSPSLRVVVAQQRASMSGRQFAALGLLLVVIAALAIVHFSGGPLWLEAVLAAGVMLALVLWAFAVVVPLVQGSIDE
jgi:hypothetical protein